MVVGGKLVLVLHQNSSLLVASNESIVDWSPRINSSLGGGTDIVLPPLVPLHHGEFTLGRGAIFLLCLG